MTIKLDRSETCVVVVCHDCFQWQVVAADMIEGHNIARAHERLAHPGESRAANAADRYLKRHAGDK